MLSKAQQSGLSLSFLSANIHLGTSPLRAFAQPSNVVASGLNVTLQPYIIKTYASTVRPVRVGVLGLFGPDAALCSASQRGSSPLPASTTPRS